jgi:uncharacterized protein (TIGR02246 family)
MRAATPLQLAEQFGAALNDGDVDALMTLYEPEALFLPEPGKVVTDRDEIREGLEQFATLIAGGRLDAEVTELLLVGDMALMRNRWTLQGTRPDGTAVEMSGHSTGVHRRATDGSWRIVIDDPWGTGA